MIPSRTLWEAIQNLAAADVATLNPAAANKVHLTTTNFTPSLDIAVGTLAAHTFTGSAALATGTGAPSTYYDVVSGYRVIELKEPVGGWHWSCTAAPTTPETIYGWFVTDSTGATLLGSGRLASPVTISA